VLLSYGDKHIMCLYENEKQSYIRVFDTEKALAGGKHEAICEIAAPADLVFTKAVWGPKNGSIIIATNIGKLMTFNLEQKAFVYELSVHKNEILSLQMTYDFTMLITGSRDGYSKLVHPETFETIKEFHYGKPCRSATISPLFDSKKHQKFHVICAGGQDAKDVTTTGADSGGFEMKMYNIIFGDKLVEITGHFGPVHSTSFSPDGHAFASGAEEGYVHYHRFPPEYFTKKLE
jgi:translation initiation factor 3 subunit I